MNALTPKETFLKNKLVADRHRELVISNHVNESLQTALAEMVMAQPSGENLAKAWDAHNRLEGAKTFIRTWLNLGEVPKQNARQIGDNLEPLEPLKK